MAASGVLGMAGCLGESDDTGGDGDTGSGDQTTDGGSDSPEITLSIADSMPADHIWRRGGTIPFIERVEELTDGRVQFEEHPAEQLGSASEMYDLLEGRAVDVAYVAPSYHPDSFYLSTVAELPGSFDTAEQGGLALWDIAQGALFNAEFEPMDIMPLFTGVMAPYQVFFADDKPMSQDEFGGLSIRTAGGTMSVTVDALGATPVEVPAPEMYSAMERGTVDATALPISGPSNYDLIDLLHAGTQNLSMGSFVLTYSMRIDEFNDLPEYAQDAIQDAGEYATQHLGEFQDEEDQKIVEGYKEAGVDMYDLPENEASSINNRLAETVEQNWLEQQQDRGLDQAGDVLAAWQDAVEARS